MDLYSILGFGLFIAVSAIVIICVSVIGTREKTFEEALAEQKQKAQEIALQSKQEKPTKDKKKKHLRKSKEKNEKGFDIEVNHKEVASSTTITEVPETKIEKLNTAKSKNAATSKKNSGHQDDKPFNKKDVVKESAPNFVLEAKSHDANTKHKHDKEEGRDKPGITLEIKVKDTVSKEDEEIKTKSNKKNQHEKQKQPAGKAEDVKSKPAKVIAHSEENHVKDEPPIVKTDAKETKTKISKSEETVSSKKEENQQHTSTTSPSKKNKKREFGGEALNGTRLAAYIKNAILTEAEMQTLIEILLNKQQEGESWVKQGQKMDPLSALKKQLQEKEQALADEQLASQGASTKLKEVRQELTRYIQQERVLREKLTASQQDIQNLQVHCHRTLEQREVDMNSLKMEFQQMQSKLEKEHHLTVQRLQEENEKLECAIAQVEAEGKKVTASEIGRLQHEVDQWRATVEQLQAQNSSTQQNNSDLQQHVHQLQQQIQQMEEENNQQGNAHQKQLNEMLSQISQMESEKNSLHYSFQTLQTENNTLQSKLMNLEKSSNSYTRNIKEMEAKLRAAEENATKYASEAESRQCEYSKSLEGWDEEKTSYQLQIEKLSEDLNKKDLQVTQLQEEVNNKSNTLQRLKEDIEMQRSKNNEAVTQEVSKDQDLIKGMLENCFPNIAVPSNLNFSEWLHRFENEIQEFLAKESSDAELRSKLAQAEETENALTAQVQNYQAILTETESMLNKLQKSVEREEETWKERLSEKENEVKQLKEEKKSLEEEKAALVSSLEQIKAAEEAAAEMQEKLKELKDKLQIEENEKRNLELRFKEVQNTNVDIRKELEETAKELSKVRNEHNSLDNLKKELETELEKEKKTSKDLTSQNVKLNSLLRIGQDALKEEQDEVVKLKKQLSEYKASTTNGSACPNDSTIELDSRSRENDMYHLTDSPAPSPFKSKIKKRGSSSKK